MDTVFSSITWDEAVRSYLIHLKAVRASNTVRFYEARLCMLTRWANENQIPGALQIQGKSVLPDYDRINSFARGRCAVCPSDTNPRLRAFSVRRPNSRRPYSEGIDSVVQYQADLP